ncbi:hypothetical protein JKF63_04582 [Porcisia hertigi]|uniref:Uncharacterized protein n=1 Tax=Porcisia hertigi TaxID=2761500 RepID=A0A836I0U1_9TRYP|nr:hypothetical protein JKF63_04582 [Porcisia hertigi]
MSTAVFELFSKLATAASVGQPGTSSALAMAPPQMLLPTDEECVLYGQKKPIVFFYEPRTTQQHPSNALEGNTGPSAGAASMLSSRTMFLQGWPAEMSATQLSAPGTSVHALRVTNAEDDLHAMLSTQEVWADWPKTIRGWQLCPVNHLCAVLRTKAAPPNVHLLASRYELVGTSAVYERYLLLTSQSNGSIRGAESGAPRGAMSARASASISVTELRALRRVACLCRCFCSSALKVQPRVTGFYGGACGGSGGDTCEPPPPLADHVLRLVPTSLQYTFCFAATALLSAADEDRCQSWATTTTALSRKKLGSVQQSCSMTEAANTSGALSDVGHTTYFESVSRSRDRSISTVRVVEGAGGGCGGTTGAAGVSFSEDRRSASSTPAQPSLAVSRMDEQHDSSFAWRHHEDVRPEDDKGTLGEALPPSQQWRAMALRRLLNRSHYDEQVPAGWWRWRYASSGVLSRALVVDSLDGIIRYTHGSRLAFYTAVSFLDRFVAVTVDPLANFLAYKRQINRARMRQELDCCMLGMPGSRPTNSPSPTETAAQQLYATSVDTSVQGRDICNFLTQAILVCIMLGSKTVDLYPPRIRNLIGCVEDTASISEEEFVILEFHILLTLGFPVHPVTLFEAAGTLLTFTTSDALYGTLTASYTTRKLLEEHQDRCHHLDNVDRLMQEVAAVEKATAVAGSAQRPPAAALTWADRQAINDWLRLRLFTFFICDEVIRADATDSAVSPLASASSASDSTPPHDGGAPRRIAVEEDANGLGSEINLLQLSPVLVAAAALVVAAEQLRIPLPAPVLRLLPDAMQAHLRDVPAYGSGEKSQKNGDDGSGRNLTASYRRGPHVNPCNVVIEEPNVPNRRIGSVARHNEALTGLRLTAGPTDDHYKVLMELSRLLEEELRRLSDDEGSLQGLLAQSSMSTAHPTSTLPIIAVGEEEPVDVSSCAVVAAVESSTCPASPYTAAMFHGGATRRDASSSSLASPLIHSPHARAIAMFGRIIAQIKLFHRRNGEKCPPVLLQRYRFLFRGGA